MGIISRKGRGSPEKREPGMAFLTQENPFWPKPFCDLNLATKLALEQVSVINDLKGTKECRNKEKAVKKQWFCDRRVLDSPQEIHVDVENGLEDTGRGKGKVGRSERVAWTYIHYQM